MMVRRGYLVSIGKGVGMTAQRSSKKPTIALVLQGGGALGAYHIGAYQALAEHDFHPDWVAGISIGAINSAVIAGNRPEERVEKLDALWDSISWPEFKPPVDFLPLATLHNIASNAEALLFGQPNFFSPRPINPYLISNAAPQTVSFYDTTPLLFTLRRFAGFGLINDKITRLSLGATNIATGKIEFFDNHHMPLGPEHVLASGSLPPGFPATQIGNNYYWDGGCVSNTPLNAIVDDLDDHHYVVFMIDLWDIAGPAPTNINEVMWRSKQIQYASRTPAHIDAMATKMNLRHAQRELETIRAARSEDGSEEKAVIPERTPQRLDIVHIIYHPGPDQIPNSDAEFSRTSIAERRAAGYRDLKAAIDAAPWLFRDLPPDACALVHRVENAKVTTLSEPEAHAAPFLTPSSAVA
jgi:NTE family protein